MTFVIVKALVGYIVRPDVPQHEAYFVEGWGAFNTWEEASEWIGRQFMEGAK